jgi:outer membrane lipase/esterase
VAGDRALHAADLCGALSAPAIAGTPFNQMIVFGGSYEDAGQFPDIDFFAVGGIIPPPGAGLDGSTGFRVTNLVPETGKRGTVWPEKLSNDLGIGGLQPSTPILFPGERTDIPDTDNIDFAFATARSNDMYQAVVAESVVTHPADGALEADLSETSPGFEQRLASGALSITRRTLFVLNPAGNDVRDATVENPAAAGEGAALNTLRMIERLMTSGARTFVTPTFPPLGLFSESTNLAPDGGRTPKSEARNAAAEAYNEAMARGLAEVGGNVVVPDFDRLLREAIADPGAFGFNPTVDHTRLCYSSSEATVSGTRCTEPEGLGKSSGGNPDDFFAYDGLHPTQAMAQILSDYTASILRAPGMIALLPESALADARAFGNTVADYQIRRRWGPRPEGFDLFASVQGQDVDYDKGFSTPRASSDAVDLTLGTAYTLSDHWFVGAAIGSQVGDTDIDNSGSEFENETLVGSLFLGYRSDLLFSDFTLSVGEADLDDIERVIHLGSTARRVEKGDTEADILGFSTRIGVNMTAPETITRFGPFLELDYLNIEVDGYEEQGTASTAMAFGDQERDSLLGSAGVFVSHPFKWGDTDMEVYGDFAYRYEFEDEADDVKAVVKNLSSGVHFRMPGYEIDDQSLVVRAGIGANWGALRCNLFGSYENNDRETTYLGVSIAFDL